MVTTTTWEGSILELRKQARRIENEIDSKLVSFNKLGATLGGTTRPDQYSASTSIEKVPLLSSSGTFDTLSSELEINMNRLTQINDQMTLFVNQAGNSSMGSNPALLHTLQRHRDILHDYSNEFIRTRNTIQSRIDRERLLESDESGHSGGLNNRRSDGFLKEHEHVKSSHRLLDEQISIAIATKENMQSQRSGLKDITKKIQTITKRYPALNSVMQKIHMKKRRDTIVIAIVISVCLILMFLYANAG